MQLLINSIDFKGSIVDGPGIRTVLYLQGCEKSCVGCHNPQTWNIKRGVQYDLEELVKLIEIKSLTKKITISGGEPLLQPMAVLALIKQLKHFNIALYTGFLLEDVPQEIIQYIDYLKVGPFVQALKSSTIPYVGSSNQVFYQVIRGELNECTY